MKKSDGGFTVIELVVSVGIIIAIMGVALVVVGQARDALDRDGMGVEAAQRLRAGLDGLLRDIRAAGVGAEGEVSSTPLAHAIPVIDLLPGGAPDDGRFGAIRVTSVPAGAAYGATIQRAVPGLPLQLAPTRNCVALPVCGFSSGAVIVVYDGSGAFDVTRVEAVDPATMTIVVTPALSREYDVGARITEIAMSTFELEPGDDGTQRLVRRTAAGAVQPIVDQVVGFSIEAFGDASPPAAGRTPRSPPTYGPAPPEPGVDDPRDAWGPGENCTLARASDGWPQPRLASLGDAEALVGLTRAQLQDGPWCLAPAGASYDADLFRVRRVDIRLRVEAVSARLRGPAGALFTHGGRARPSSMVPDLEFRLSVSPPNVRRR